MKADSEPDRGWQAEGSPPPLGLPEIEPDVPDKFKDRMLRASQWFFALRDRLCSTIVDLEEAALAESVSGSRPQQFEIKKTLRQTRTKQDGGGGQMAVLRDGQVFEKVGVNASTVYGQLGQKMSKAISARRKSPDFANNAQFWASGISLVAHPRNPRVPAVHLNTRMFWTPVGHWFGGGTDLNPCLEFPNDVRHFHGHLERICDRHDQSYYRRFSEWADRYFHVPHRGRARGVGGIFFDDLCSGNWDGDFSFVRDVGESFFDAYLPIVRRRRTESWSDDDRVAQLLHRGLYVEFNLLYDRGTRFGLESGHDADAVLMSLPPMAKWR